MVRGLIAPRPVPLGELARLAHEPDDDNQSTQLSVKPSDSLILRMPRSGSR
jgi:hypothetical protein